MTSPVPWTTDINFASALLLHSCITILLKEGLNTLEISRRWLLDQLKPSNERASSAVLDAYTSILSNDKDGALAELYFTNTGFILLAISLAGSVAMNLLVSNLVLNCIVAGTFGLTLIASLGVCRWNFTLPIMALRRAGRFIWSDTPFVNFFSLIYLATVLGGQPNLRLQDYVIFRAIAVVELVYMKAKIAASDPKTQIGMIRSLLESELVVLSTGPIPNEPGSIRYDTIQTFSSRQRMQVMLLKTSVSYHGGGATGYHGPSSVPVPGSRQYLNDSIKGLKVYRYSDDILIIAADAMATVPSSNGGLKGLIFRMHGILLRQLGKVRVIYAIREKTPDHLLSTSTTVWHANVNLVTGISKVELERNYELGTPGGLHIIR